MANIIYVNAYQAGTTPPSKIQDIGVASILDVLPYTDANYPFIKTVIFTTYQNYSALYVNETVAEVIALIQDGGAVSPNLQINALYDMIVGTGDQLLGYTSLSAGAVTYTSSDETKGTIVSSGGSFYLHAVAAGSVTVTANQAAATGYTSATSPTPASISAISGLVADFNFNVPSSLSIAAGKVASITDAVGNVTNSQATGAQQPTYSATGGPANKGYAGFTGTQTLAGNLLTPNVQFTMVCLRLVTAQTDPYALLGIWQNGNTNAAGYGIADYYGSKESAHYPPGSSFPTVQQYVYGDRWEVIVLASGSSNNSFYNSLGFKFLTTASAAPDIPVGGNIIGNINLSGINKFKGGISRLMLYNVKLTDNQIAQICTLLSQGLNLPTHLCTEGDSRMTTLGGSPNCPMQIISQAVEGTYLYLDNPSLSGAGVADVIADIPTLVVPTYTSRTDNVFTVMIGINDVIAGQTPTYIYNGIVTICGLARAAGYTIVVCTDMYTNNATQALVQDTYNASIRTNWATFADALCDLNAIPQGSVVNMSNPTYSSDGIHPTAVLAGIMATSMLTTIQSL